MSGQGNPFRGIRSGLLDLGDGNVVQAPPQVETSHPPIFKEGQPYCVQASEFELMARFSRKHNRECQKSIKNSGEDGQPYCRYLLDASNNGIGQNLTLECRECGVRESCTEWHNA